MKTRLQKLMGASAGAGAICGFFVMALVGMLCAFPNTAHAAEPGIIGINFASGKADIESSDTDMLGFVSGDKGGEIATSKWNKVTGGSNTGTQVTDVNGNSYTLVYDSAGVYQNGTPDALISKLTYGYLDIANFDGGKTLSLSLSGLPKTGYDVAIIASGDGGAFSPFTVNGTQYTATTAMGTYPGTAGWGTRAGAATLTEGTNVLYVPGEVSETLTITSDRTNGRGSLAALMIFPKAVQEATSARVISLNFTNGGDGSGIVTHDLEGVPNSAWMHFSVASGTSAISKYWDGEQPVALADTTVTWSSSNTYAWPGATDAIIKGYLDDGGSRATITLPNIPFTKYDVITYHATDTENRAFKAVRLTDSKGTQTYYTANDDDPTTAAVVTGDGETTSFGWSRGLVAAYATSTTGNALRIRNLASPSLEIKGGSGGNNSPRGGIAAIQIIEVPVQIYKSYPEADATYSDLTWEVDDIEQEDSPTAGDVAEVTLVDGTTLTIDEALALIRLRLVCSGDCTLVVNDPAYLDNVGALDFSGVTGQVTIASPLSSVQSWSTNVVYAGGAGSDESPVAVGLNGGTLNLSGSATYYLADTMGISTENTGKDTVVNITDATVETGIFAVGQMTYNVGGTAKLNVDQFSMPYDGRDRVAKFNLTDSAAVTVSGTTNGDDTSSSIMFGFWNGPTTYTQSGNATFTAAGTDVLIGRTQNNHTINIAGGTFTVRGLKLSENAIGTNTLNLSGGELVLGESGITAYTTNTMQINVTGDTKITSAAAMTISQPIDLEHGAVLTLDATAGDITLTHIPTGGGKIKVAGGKIKFAVTDETAAAAVFDAKLTGTAPKATINIVDGDTLAADAITATWGGAAATVTTTATTVTITAPTAETANPTYTGNQWWWDYEFNGNTQSVGRFTTTLVTEGAVTTEYNGAEGDTNRALYFHRTPYTQPASSPVYPTEFTALMYCQPGNHANTALIGFGSSTQGSQYAITLATGDNPAAGQMKLVLSQGMAAGGATILANLEVPNATTAYHLYAFTLKVVNGVTQVSIYLDGKLITQYTHDEVIVLGSGFQVGSIHGGVGEGNPLGITKYGTQAGYTENPDVDTGLLDFLRVADFALSDAAIARLSAEDAYPYVSPTGLATRTVTATDTTWEEEATWSQTANNATTVQAAPNAGTNVVVTVDDALTDGASLNLNLSGNVTYETMKVKGNPLTLAKVADNASVMTVQGLTVESNLAVPYESVKVGTLAMAANTTLTFDVTSLFEANKNTLTAQTYTLTGTATMGAGATVLVTPTEKDARKAVVAFDAGTQTWKVTITTPEHGFMKLIEANADWSDVSWVPNTKTQHDAEALVVYTTGNYTLTGDEAVTADELIFAGDAGTTLSIAGSWAFASVPSAVIETNVSATAEGFDFFQQVEIAEGKTYTYDTGAATATFHKIKGPGTLVKEGSGTLRLQVASATARTVAEEVTIDVQGGTLQTYLEGTDNNPILKNVTLKFATGTAFQSHGWLGLDGTVTVDVAGGEVDFAAANGFTPSIQGAGTLVKNGDGTFTVTLFNTETYANLMTVNDGTLGFKTNDVTATPTLSGVISGAGKLELTSGTMTLAPTAANTYTGGTHIAEGATLTMEHTGALGTSGAITGAGTLLSTAGMLANRNGLSAEAWTGLVKITADMTFADTENWLAQLGNANSTIELAGTNTGYLQQAGSCAANLVLSGSMTFNNGYSDDGGYTFTGTFSGDGTLATSNTPTDVIRFTGDTSGFTGTITVAGGHCVAFGDDYTDNNSGVGTIQIDSDKTVTIPAGKTWSAVNGVKVAGTLKGTGTIDGTVAFSDGASLDATDATPLTVTGAVSGTGTLKVYIPVAQRPAFGTTGYQVIAGAAGSVTIPTGEVYLVDGETSTKDETLSLALGVDGLYVQNVDASAMKTWKPTVQDGGLYKWSTLGNWSQDGVTLTALPGENEAVLILTDTDTTLTMDVADTVAAATFKGEGAVTLAGEALTVTDTVTVDTTLTLGNAQLVNTKWSIQENAEVRLTVADGVVTYNRIGGIGTMTKLGAGTLRLQVASVTDRTVAEEVTIDVQGGTLQTYLPVEEGNNNPILKNVTLKFATGTAFQSHGWLVLDGTVTVETAGEVDFAAANGLTPSIQGSGTLVKTGVGTFTVTLFNTEVYANLMTVNGGTLGFKTNDVTATPTLSGVISGTGNVAILGATVKMTAANTYTGTTTIENGGILEVTAIDRIAASSQVIVNETGTLKFVAAGNARDTTTDLSKIKGTGTIWYSGDGNRTLPNAQELRFASTLGVRNDQEQGLIITEQSAESPVTTIGSVSGSAPFRVDWVTGVRTLRIVQSANTEHTGAFIYNGQVARLTKITVAGAEGATEKTLTLSGATEVARPLEIEASGSVAINGSWAGAVTVNGELGGSGTISGAVTIAAGATLVVGETPLTVPGATLTQADTFTIRLLDATVGTGKTVLKFSGTTMPSLVYDAITVEDAEGNPVTGTLHIDEEEAALVLLPVAVTRTVSGEENWSAANEWLQDGVTYLESAPQSGANIDVTCETVDGVEASLHVDTVPLQVGTFRALGEVPLTLRFDAATLVTSYHTIPRKGLSVELVTATSLENVTAVVEGLEYGAMAQITATETGLTALITLPEALYEGTDPDALPTKLAEIVTYRATISGTVDWDTIAWVDETGATLTEKPTTTSLVELTLAGDTTLTADMETLPLPQALSLSVYGNGYALTVPDLAVMERIQSWRFEDTTYVFAKEADELPEATEILPKRIRYDYAYVLDEGYTTTTEYETEFAAGYVAPSPILAGGVLEFSDGQVTVPMIAPSVTQSTLIFSGDVMAELTEAPESESNGVSGLRLGQVDFRMRGNAVVRTPKFVTTDKYQNDTQPTNFLTTVLLEDNAVLEVTGSNDSMNNTASFLLAHWNGQTEMTLRDRAQVVASRVGAALAHSGATTITLEDEALFKVRGVRMHSTVSAGGQAGATKVSLKGGRLLLGEGGIQTGATHLIDFFFEGGALGAWQDVTIGADAIARCSIGFGSPRFVVESGITMTFEKLGSFATRAKIDVEAGNVRFADETVTTLPNLTVQKGAQVYLSSDMTMDTLTLDGGTLAFDGGILTLTTYVKTTESYLQIPLVARLSDGGYLKMANDGALPDLSATTFKLWVDPDRASYSRIQPELPLCLGTDNANLDVTTVRFSLNSTNNAVTSAEAALKDGLLGEGLYVLLKGSEVLQKRDVTLSDVTNGTPLEQASADVYPFQAFTSTVDGARLVIAEGGVVLPQSSFSGERTCIVATGTTPEVLLQGMGCTIAADLTFDLTAWKTELETFVRGAVKGVPASLCLVSGGLILSDDVDLQVTHTVELPEGFTATVEATNDGIYFVVSAERSAKALSVNFTNRATPLAATPASIGVYSVPVGVWNTLSENFSSATLTTSDRNNNVGAPAANAEGLPTQLLVYTTQVGTDATASTSLLQVWVDDTRSQMLQLVNVPFDAYRVALIFATDVDDAAFVPATIGGHVYTMDADPRGYTRRDIMGGRSGATATGTPTVDVPADSEWGSTAHTASETPIVFGQNALVTDVFTTPEVTLTLPAFEYGLRYAGLAAIQLIEAPVLVAPVQEDKTYTYTFATSETPTTDELTAVVELAKQSLVVGDGTAPNEAWANGASHTLVVQTTHAEQTVTLVLPAGFEAKSIVCEGPGSLTLKSESTGVVVTTLDAGDLEKDLTVAFSCIGVDFVQAQGVSRFEQLFDNNEQPYVINEGATLHLTEDCGITTTFDSNTPLLTVSVDSEGTLRRDYPVVQTVGYGGTGATIFTVASKIIFAGRQMEFTKDPDNSGTMFSVAEGDTHRHTNRFHLMRTDNTPWVYTQTGGLATFEATVADGGMLLFNRDSSNGPHEAELNISGGRLEAVQLTVYRANAEAIGTVSGSGVMGIGTGGFRAANGTACNLEVTFTDGGTLEAMGATLPKEGDGTVKVAFNGGRIVTKQTVSTITAPLSFDGAAEIAPEMFSKLVLAAANTGVGPLTVTQGTLAVSHANALNGTSDQHIAVTVKAGATFEAQALTTASGVVTFEAGSTLAATATDPFADEATSYVAKIADTLALPKVEGDNTVIDVSQLSFLLNGEHYTVDAADINEAEGTVTFRSANKPDVSDLTVIWSASATEGTWQEGVTDPSPWESGLYYNGATVSFAAEGAEKAKVMVNGPLAPKQVLFDDANAGLYTFTAKGSSYLDLSQMVAALEEDAQLDLGADQTFDIPINTGAVSTPLAAKPASFRLIGQLSEDRKTASLVASGSNLNVDGPHGLWHGAADYGLVLTPHAGEVQVLGSHEHQLTGSGEICITGQTAEDETVSGGIVRFSGWVGGTNWNGQFRGNFRIQNGAMLDIDFGRVEGGVTETKDDNGNLILDDNYPFFRKSDAAGVVVPIWTTEVPAFTLRNGATLRFGNNCRSIISGLAQRNNEDFVTSRPIVIGKDSTVHFDYNRNTPQVISYGLTFNGDNAKVVIGDSTANNRGLYLVNGVTLYVAGSGDEGDPLDTAKIDINETLESTGEPNPYYMKIKQGEGIVATLEAASTNVGLTCYNGGANDFAEAITFHVGDNSLFRILANITLPANATENVSYVKTGTGRLTFEYPSIDARVALDVEAGTLGGSSELSHVASTVTVANGATLEAGLYVPTLICEPGSTLAIDPSGTKLIRTQSMQFTANSAYTVTSLLDEAEIAPAAGRAPVKVISWADARDVGTARFVLDERLVEKGYGVSIREDGLYLMESVIYVRELDFEATSSVTYAWYAANAWYRYNPEDPTQKVMTNYAATEAEAATARFILPAAYAEVPTPPLSVTLTLDQPVSFSSVVFGVEVEDEETGETVFKPVSVTVTYQYLFTEDHMPAYDEAKEYTWVPSLLVEGANGSVASVALRAKVPEGYYTVTRDTTVIIYREAFAPAININFTGDAEGSTSWVDSATAPCGAIPFAGAYWNNASPATAAVLVYDNHYTAYSTTANIVGVENDAEGGTPTTAVTFLAYDMNSVPSRQGSGNACLASGYLEDAFASPLESLFYNDTGFTNPKSRHGWQVRVDAVPFTGYDLYLLFAGETDATVTYPAVRIKVGDEDWRTYSMANGWTAPAATTHTWQGTGDLVNGGFALGKNMLHLRVVAPMNAALEIAPSDTALGANSPSLGLAALQIVECDDGVQYERVGAGSWSDAAGWKVTTLTSSVTGAWQDATTDAPHFAALPNISSLDADIVAAAPWVRASGSRTMTFSGAAGALHVGAMDLRDLTESAEVHFEDDFFAAAPNVVLAPEITFTIPESDASTTNDWIWVYDDDSSASAETSMLKKTSANDLTIARMILSKLYIGDGMLWLSTEADGSYERSQTITGYGTFGKTGANTLTIPFASLRTEGEVIARVNEGTLEFKREGDTQLPAEKTIIAEESGIARFGGTGANQHYTAPFLHGKLVARNGGTIMLSEATNLFNIRNDATVTPSVFLEDGRFLSNHSGSVHYHLNGLNSTGDSLLQLQGVGAYEAEPISFWSGELTILDGTLALETSHNIDNHFVYVCGKAVDYPNATASKGGVINVADGAFFYANHPICGRVKDADPADNALFKVGGGTWVQTQRLSSRTGANGGNNSNNYNVPIEVLEGILRWNLGARVQEPTPKEGESTVALRIASGAKMDGAGTLKKTTVMVKAGGTLASGLPTGWSGIELDHRWYSLLPQCFKREADGSLGYLDIEAASFEADAILEISMASGRALKVGVENADGTTTGSLAFGTALTVRLTDLPAEAPTAPKKLTNFVVAPLTKPQTINCVEAAALASMVRFGYDVTNDDGVVETMDPDNLYLVPTDNAYLWEGDGAAKEGNWSSSEDGINPTEIAWTLNGESKAFPFEATTTAELIARICATETAPATLWLDKKPTTTSDGARWALQMLILSSEEKGEITLRQGATLPTDADAIAAINTYLLNRPGVSNTLWKLGAGNVTTEVPIAFGPNATRASVIDGTLTVKHPFILGGTVDAGTTDVAVVPTTMEVAEGALLRFALTTDDATTQTAKYAVAGATPIGYNPLKQTLAGDLTGAGTIELDGAGSQLVLQGTKDNDLNYNVKQGTLTLAAEIPVLARQTPRTITLAPETVLELKTSGAAGYTENLIWTLTAADTDTSELVARERGAQVTTENGARVRGKVTLVSEENAALPKAFMGTNSGSFDGDVTFAVPAGTQLTLGGEWSTPGDTTEGQITKLGSGTLIISGNYASNLPLELREGIIRLTGAVKVIDNNHAATMADWTLRSGTRLSLESGGTVDLGAGSLTIDSGATLNITGDVKLGVGNGEATGVTFANASVLRMVTENGLPATLTILRPSEIENSVLVNLDALADALATCKESAFTLVRFESATRRGSGTFDLSGEKMVDIAKAGWSLYDEGTTVELRRLGAGTTYTWGGTDGNWNSTTASWYLPTATTAEDKVTWADITTTSPAVLFQDYDVADKTALVTSTEVTWTAGKQTLAALRSDNTELDYTLKAVRPDDLAEADFSANLTIEGDLLKTGDGTLTIDRPLVLNANTGLLKALGGRLEFLGALKATSGNFERPVTVAGDAELRFGGVESRTLLGRIDGDNTGTITQAGTATLTFGSVLDKLKALTIESGAVRLTAKDHATVVPQVTLAETAQLVYAGSFSTVADVALQVNNVPTADGSMPAPAGTLIWEAETSVNTSYVPNFVAPTGATTPVLNVDTFRYAPTAGHLVINPGAAIFPETTKLELNTDATVESLALLLGSDTRDTTAPSLIFSGLTGTGGLIGVEPTVGSLAYAWATDRVLTLRLAEDNTFSGAFMGALTADNVRITAGLAIEKAAGATTDPIFTYTGSSTNEDLGTLSVGANTRVEVTGTWAGDVAVAAGGELAGNGLLGGADRTVDIPAGARIVASAMGKRETQPNVYVDELLPTDLTVQGDLALETGSEMTVLVRKDLTTEAPLVSCVTTDRLVLPDNAGTVSIKVYLDREDANYVVSNIPILKWTNLLGATRIDGQVYYRTKNADGTYTVDTDPTSDYYLRQENGMLKLMRTSARFWMILQ